MQKLDFMIREVKKEGTSERPSVLSTWYRATLGPRFAVSDIDWFITNIDNRNPQTRYMIIEEKNVSSFDSLLIGLGQFRSLKEIVTDAIKSNIPVFVVFIKDSSVSNGVYVYKFDLADANNKKLWTELDGDWYVDVGSKSKFLTENELEQLIRNTTK